MMLRTTILITLALVLCSGCARRHAPTAVSAPPTIQQQSPEVTFQVLGSDKKAHSDDVDYAWPRAKGELAVPEYPPRAFAKQSGPVTIGVRIVIGIDGTVTEVSESPRIQSTPGPFLPDFRAAVEKAVKTWQFTPAEWRLLEDGSDLNADGRPDFQKLFARQLISVYYDVRFQFSISEGKALVGMSGTP